MVYNCGGHRAAIRRTHAAEWIVGKERITRLTPAVTVTTRGTVTPAVINLHG